VEAPLVEIDGRKTLDRAIERADPMDATEIYTKTRDEIANVREGRISELADENRQLRAELKEFNELKEYAKSLGQETYLELHAKNERLRKTLQAIANLDKHERDGKDETAETMRRFARKALEL
jgi:hypothetical protein